MRTTLNFILSLLFGTLSVHAETAPMKAKVMIVPEDAYCINAGFFKTDGKGNKIPDYTKALQSDNVLTVINTFENLMANYGFALTNLQQTLNDINNEGVLDLVLSSKDNSMVVEDDLDKLSRVAQADILVKIAPVVLPYGPERQLVLRVSSIDCASKKALQAFGPVTRTSAGSISMLLKATVTDNIEAFASGLASHFEDMCKNGREGSIVIKLAESCPLNLESEVSFKGETGELADLIEYWVSENAVNGAYTGAKTSRYGMKFDQVRIPLTGKSAFGKTKPMSMESFVKTGLVDFLGQYGISVSTHAVGIGVVYLTLGKL